MFCFLFIRMLNHRMGLKRVRNFKVAEVTMAQQRMVVIPQEITNHYRMVNILMSPIRIGQ